MPRHLDATRFREYGREFLHPALGRESRANFVREEIPVLLHLAAPERKAWQLRGAATEHRHDSHPPPVDRLHEMIRSFARVGAFVNPERRHQDARSLYSLLVRA